ncbi:MAG TPA: hypothetical protein VMS00_00660, partial [Acidimicrobiales bacterium]|nr:hypothetical protein [Acidimicrobiales bacterium]
MPTRRLSNRARALTACGAALSTLFGFAATAPLANASASLQFPAYTFSLATPGTNPTGPRYFEGFSNTINVAGSETAEYALEQVGALYNNAGIFGCAQSSDPARRTCNPGSSSYSANVDIYDNFDHNVVDQAQAVGSAAGYQALCATDAAGNAPTQPASLPSAPPYYTYPVVAATEGADGIPIDLVRASASISQLQVHDASNPPCADLEEQAIANDAVVGLTFFPSSTDPDGTGIEVVAPSSGGGPKAIDLSNTGGVGTATDTAWRVFCDGTAASASDPLAITTWDQLYEAEGLAGAPNPDQPIVLWGTKNNSGTGAAFYDFAGCGTTTGRILANNHLITENN